MNFIKGLESLLEQVDQTASKLAKKEDGTDDDGSPAVAGGQAGAGGASRSTPTSGRIQPHTRPAAKPKSDDEIFAFLNTSSPSPSSSPVRPAATTGRGTAARGSSSARAKPAVGGGRGKASATTTSTRAPVARKLNTGEGTPVAVSAKPSSASGGGGESAPGTSTQPSAAAAGEGGKPSSPKGRGGGSDEEQEAAARQKQARQSAVAHSEHASGMLADTSDADTEKEPSEEERKPTDPQPPSASPETADAALRPPSVDVPSPAGGNEGTQQQQEEERGVKEGEEDPRVGTGDSPTKSAKEEDEESEEEERLRSDSGQESAESRQRGGEKGDEEEEEEDAHRTSGGESSEGDTATGADEEEEEHSSSSNSTEGDDNKTGDDGQEHKRRRHRSFDDAATSDDERERADAEEEESSQEPDVHEHDDDEEGDQEQEHQEREQDEEEQEEGVRYEQSNAAKVHLEQQVDALLNEGAKLKMENKLMRSEVRALNDEVTSLTERITNEHEALERANDALHALQREVLDKDRQLMRLRKQEDEFDAVLAKKDAQHAALQVKLEEANLHVSGLEQTMNALKQEIDRLGKEKDETGDLHKQSIALINAKIVELEAQLKEERENASSQRSLALERERNLESDISEYTKALGQAQRAIEEKNKQVEKHMATIKELEANVQGLKQELTDYKLRAKKVLQQREATIHELTEKLTSPGGASAEEGQLQEKWKELLLQKQEYEKMKVDFEETKDELNKFRHNLAQTQEQAEHDALEFEEQIKSLEDELEKERERVRKVQFELAQRLQELHVTKDQVAQTTSTLHEQIKDRDAQIAKLKRQITAKGIQAQSSSQAELESSLTTMTDRLIRLQALNETLTNEKAALQMRLNTEVQSRREREGIRRSGDVETRQSGDISSIIINTGGSSSSKDKSGPRLRSIASLVPESWSGDPESKRHQVYTHTLRAASALDTFTAQVGRILRRNPLARLLLILYMLFLHVWVLFLLSRPLEIHDMMDEPLPPGAVAPTGLPEALLHAVSAPAAEAAVGM